MPLLNAEPIPDREVIEDKASSSFWDSAKSVYDTVMNPDESLPTGGVVGAAIGALGVAAKGKLKPTTKPFYSAVEKAVGESKLNVAPANQWQGTLKNIPGIKQEEMDWIGLDDWLSQQKGKVAKEDIQGFVRENQVDVQEVVKGDTTRAISPDEMSQRPPHMTEEEWIRDIRSGDAAEPKFATYQLPGGENYRELLLTMPPKGTAKQLTHEEMLARLSRGDSNPPVSEVPGSFTGGHYDEPNVLAHVRFNDRVDAQGKKTLFIEEIQSDWHQKGRKEGYRGQEKPVDTTGFSASEIEQFGEPYWKVVDAEGNHFFAVPRFAKESMVDAIAKAAKQKPALADTNRIPDAPFKTSWPELSLKRMIRWAAENDYDQIAWTPGKVQAQRYDLSKQLSRIDASPAKDGGWNMRVYDKDGHLLNEPISHHGRQGIPDSDLSDRVGKELAEKIITQNGGEFRGLDLQVGGEGMNAFYDKILPNAANKLGKKFGAKVEVTKIKTARRTFDDEDMEDLVPETPEQEALLRGHEKFVDPHEQEVWSLPITDAMKQKALGEGFPMFSVAGPAGLLPIGSMVQDYFDSRPTADPITGLPPLSPSTTEQDKGQSSKLEL